MSEQGGAEATKVQLHLRVRPEIVRLLDICRGAATRNAYAAMVLENELHQIGSRPAPTEAPAQRQPPADAEPGPGIPAIPDPPGTPAANCTHPKARVLKGLCRACGTYVG